MTNLNPAQAARLAMRRGEWIGPTKHTVPGYVKTNVVILPRVEAYDFLVFCHRNPQSCPLVEILDVGDPEPKYAAPGADIRTDLPRYAIYRLGKREEDRTDISDLWQHDSVCFLIGSGMTWDDPLEAAGVPKMATRLYETSIATLAAGKYRGSMVVTMRLMAPTEAIIATQLTARFVQHHGAPVHIGDPAAIGVKLNEPIVGEPLTVIPEGQLAVFWACGVTLQWVAQKAQPQLMITHAPAHSFITDLKAEQVCLP